MSDRNVRATFYAVLFHPRRFFSRPAAERSDWSPLKFAAFVALLSAPVAAFVDRVVAGRPAPEAAVAFVVFAFAGPLSAVVSVFVVACLAHLWLWLLRGRRAPFRETLACAGYSYAPFVLSVVPLFGSVVANVWQLVLLGVGLHQVHRVGVVRSTLAVLAGPASLVVVALALRVGVVEAFKVPSAGMMPTIEPNDHVFVSKLSYGPLLPGTRTRILSRLPPPRGDLIVFEYPDPNPSHPRQDFVKRAIGIAGDTIVVEDGHPIVNGWHVPSCRAGSFTFANGSSHGDVEVEFLGEASYLVFFEADRSDGRQGPYTVAPGQVWVLGDNRNNSADSRSWNEGLGAGVPYANIKGRVARVWMAFGADGGVAWPRIGRDLSAGPVAPSGASPELRAGIAKCLAARPAVTTPP